MTLLYGIGAVLLIWWLSKLFASTNPKMLAKAVKGGGGVLSLGVAALLMMRGRLDMAIFVGGIGAWLLGWSATGPGGIRFPWGTSSAETPGARSQVASRLLAMELDHDSGGMTGTVSGGRFAGRSLDDLSLAEIAEARKAPTFDTLMWLVAADRGRTNVVMFQLSEDDLTVALTHPLHMLGSDGLPRETGKPHPRAFGSFPRYLARAIRGEAGLRLEEAVRHMTAVPAQRFGLGDRGLLRPGMAADLTLFTADVADRATFQDPTRTPHGITDVLVAGAFVLRDGAPTGARPGRTLTRQHPIDA